MAISERTPWHPYRRLIDIHDREEGCKYTEGTDVLTVIKDMDFSRVVADNAIRKMIRSAK